MRGHRTAVRSVCRRIGNDHRIVTVRIGLLGATATFCVEGDNPTVSQMPIGLDIFRVL